MDLPTVFTQKLCVLPQAGNTPLKKTKSHRFRFRKETVLVFAQLARHVVELRIIAKERHCLLSQRVHRSAERINAVSEHLILQGFRLLFQLFQTMQITGNELFKEIIERLPDRSLRPSFFLRNAVQEGRKRSGIVRENDAVLRNEQTVCGANTVFSLTREHKRTGQAVGAHLGTTGPRTAHRWRMFQNFFQPRKVRAFLQLLRCEQHKRRNIRAGCGFRMYKRFADTIPDH